MRGLFITIYGINNIGKTTHVRMLSKRLKQEGYDVIFVKYPVYSLAPTGHFLNRVLRYHGGKGQNISEEELQMWFTLNRYQFQPKLENFLSQGKIVIAEDYIGTGIAWGTTKGASEEWLTSLNQHLLKENLSILLKGKRFLKSKEFHHLHESDDPLVEKTGEILERLAKKNGWHTVDVCGSKEETAEKIYKLVRNFLTSPESSFS